MIDFLSKINLKDILVFDIETAPQHPSPTLLQAPLKKEFFRRYSTAKEVEMWEEDKFKTKYFGKAGLFSEWGRVVCVSVAAFNSVGDIYTKSYSHQNEKQLLMEVDEVIARVDYIAGHNVLGFDIPFLARRMVLNGIRPTNKLNVFGKKPWGCPKVIDTMVLWGGTSQGYKTSLALLALSLGLESPKEDINGADVWRVGADSGVL
jgi:hypothetical protein